MKKISTVLLFISSLALCGFEFPGNWVVTGHGGGKGTGKIVTAPAGNGKKVFQLEKHNAVGWVSIRSAVPVPVKAGVKYAFGGWFHTQSSDLQSILLFRVTRGKDEVPLYDTIDRSNGTFTQSVLVNSPPGEWKRRVVHFQSKKDENVYLHCLLFGNPAEVLLDGITFAKADFKIERLPFEERFEYPFTKEEVYKRLKERPVNSMCVKNGRLLLNGKAVSPVMYKPERRRPEQNRYEEFTAAGVQLVTVPVFISNFHEQRGAVLPGGKIDYKYADELLMRALRRNPELNLVVEFVITEPYPGWGDKYPDHVWQNEQKRRAYTTWGNIQGYTKDINSLPAPKNKELRYCYMPSYSSEIFRKDICSYLDKLVRHIMSSPVGRSVAGFHLSGGHDHQFQYPKPDYSPAALSAWRKFCNDPAAEIPQINRYGEYGTAFSADSRANLYWKFREKQAWQVKNLFAGAIKKAAGKPVTVSAYIGAPENYMPLPADAANMDIIIVITPYAFRKSGYPVGGSIPEESYALHNKIFLSEFDLRCWNYVTDNEVRDHYISVSRTFPEWKNVHRKLAGMVIAKNAAWWYMTMYHYFDDLRIMKDITETLAIAGRISAMPANPAFKPGLCIVRDRSNDIDAGAEYSISKDVKMYPLARSVFERSGVPFVTHYLDDILTKPELQNYSMYLFLHNTRLSTAEKNMISAKLKNRNRILIWLYGTGVLNESGTDIAGMKKLTGFDVTMHPGNVRRTPLFTAHELVRSLPPMSGMGELRYGIFAPSGQSPHMARGQEFSVVPDKDTEVLARYAENSRPAAVMRKFAHWTSVYAGAPWGMTPELLNRLARLNGTYTVAAAGQSIFMNDRFLSLHALKSVKGFEITPPPGTRRVTNPDNGVEIPVKEGKISIDIVSGTTYWFIFE